MVREAPSFSRGRGSARWERLVAASLSSDSDSALRRADSTKPQEAALPKRTARSVTLADQMVRERGLAVGT